MAPPSLILQVALVVTLFPDLAAPSASSKTIGFRIGLSHVGSDKNLSRMEIVQQAYQRDRFRMSLIAQPKSSKPGSTFGGGGGAGRGFQSRVHANNGNYALTYSIGTPPEQFTAIMDTGSDLIWNHCSSSSSNQTSIVPQFDPTKSSTNKNISCDSGLCAALRTHKCNTTCDYVHAYGDGSQSEGYMAADTFTFGGEGGPQASVPNVGFGCGLNNKGTGLDRGSGVMGLGRGPLSLVTQLGVQKFSYCLSGFGEGASRSNLLFGSEADPKGTSNEPLQTTKLIKNPKFPTFYYVSLEGISVGTVKLPIPKATFEMGEDGSGGVIVDSGTTMTMLSADAYTMVRQGFVGMTKLELAPGTRASGGFSTDSVMKLDTEGLDLCFDLAGKKPEEAEVPTLKFHLKGMDLELPLENYMVSDKLGKKMCLAMGPSGVLSVIGNVQQQNFLMIHNVFEDTLSIVPARCDRV